MTDVPEDDFTAPADDIQIDLGSLEGAEEPSDPGINLDFDDFSSEASDDVQIDLAAVDEAEQVARAEETSPEADEPVVEDTDADEALAQALEELHDELVVKPGDWFVVHTYSGMENRVKQNIDNRVKSLNMEDFIYETIVPTEDAVEMRNGQKKNVTRTYMPGYVLVRMEMTDESWGTVRHTPSVTGFVGSAQEPTPLSLAEVENMLKPSVIARLNAESRSTSRSARARVEVVDYAVGDQVMVIDGPFAGVHATITEINTHNQRLKANVEILGRETPVDLTFPQIQKALG
ncbi:transcription termination/antitermination protein NusG [Propionibacterium australiense]|uniref:Transcription termination/antitermination protein NusG n=1 Tax=Propionibacterium australiense TaxID=119981 RepID=A0A383S5F8_9ACTN|nr:transcription termination/antitermination protein NusG [Propionibacterium australiense]RLP11939.1 transcription termination/antitermination protein NusG [Propionibacterium australiense]RLP12577.1 transcription termination/antitermination protein NusG [Propionibacterium australiense]SYZ32599.1 Ribosomal protein L24/L26, conserved site [Propionibacterium australiense]VEH91650.1 Butanolide receptor [Propionibacterium australiense]